MTVPFTPSHHAPPDGLATRPDPDASLPPGPALPGNLPVSVERRWGDWARIRCSNGWEAWVDGRRLVVGEASPAEGRVVPAALEQSPLRVGSVAVTLPLVGSAAAGVAAFLPWLSQLGVTTTSWKVPARFLLDPKISSTGGPKVAWLVLALAGLGGWLTLRPVSRPLRKAVGWGLVLVSTVFVAQMQRLLGDLQQGGISTGSVFAQLGMGVYLAAAGGLLVALGRGQEDG